MIRQGLMKEACPHMLKASGPKARRAELWHHGACRLADMGRYDEARDWCDSALEADPLAVPARFTLALINQEAGDLETACLQLTQVLFLEPNFLPAHFILALLYNRMGQMELARRHRGRAEALASCMEPEQTLPMIKGLSVQSMLQMLQMVNGTGLGNSRGHKEA